MEHLYAGSQLAITMVVFVWLGYWADKHFGWSPWGIIGGALIGIVVGLFVFLETYVGSKKDKSA